MAKKLEESIPKTPTRSKQSKTTTASATTGGTAYPNQLKKSQKSSSSVSLLGHQSKVRLHTSSDTDRLDLIRALDEDPQVQRLVANILLNGDNQELLKKVVLSACKTALGGQGADGIFGLQRGFKNAGVHSLLMSLKPVYDESTSKLMVAFYQGIASGKSKRQSLLDAQKAVKAQGYKDGKYWAPFILLDGLN
jgi:CHAT domain-containing protein